jgi:hypothetical protein
LQDLCLERCGGAGAADVVASAPLLTSLVLHSLSSVADGADSTLAHALCKLTSLRHLAIGCVGDAGTLLSHCVEARSILAALPALTALTHLSMRNVTQWLHANRCSDLLAILRSLRALRTLEVTWLRLSRLEASSVADALPHQLQSLQLVQAELSSESLEAIAAGVSRLRELTCLEVWGSHGAVPASPGLAASGEFKFLPLKSGRDSLLY